MRARAVRLAGLVLAVVVVAASSARADVVATVPVFEGATAPALWHGGVAWEQYNGVFTATATVAPHRLLAWKGYPGFPGAFSLDAGTGASDPGDPAFGGLAAGFFEANDQVPPMGPGDDRVPVPAIPYGDAIGARDLIGADGSVASLPTCGSDDVFGGGAGAVSIAGSTLAYGCDGVPPGTPPTANSSLLSYVNLSAVGAPTTSSGAQTGSAGAFQLSGHYLAYAAVGATLTQVGSTVVKDLSTNTAAYSVPGNGGQIALQADGTMVLLGQTAPGCKPGGGAAWFSVASPVAHPLGCFVAGAQRPVDGRWVGLAATSMTSHATLEVVDLASGATQPVATLGSAAMFHGADFDGHQLAWAVDTCSGTSVQLIDDIDSGGPPASFASACPASFARPAALTLSKSGTVRVSIVCRVGCPAATVEVLRPTDLFREASAVGLPASTTPHTLTIHFTRTQRARLRRHRIVHLTLEASTFGVGLGGAATKRMFTLHTR